MNIITIRFGLINKILLFLLVLGTISCSSGNESGKVDDASESDQVDEQVAEVKVMALGYSDFSKEILSNGKLKAMQKADLFFRGTNEKVTSILFKNGMEVKKNQLIAKLDNFTLQNSLKQSLEQFERAKIDLQDILIGQGYDVKDTSAIPRSTLLAARIKSGYDRAVADLDLAKFNLNASELKAPFDGIVANLFDKENNLPTPGQRFCTIVNDKLLEAEFTIIESELNSVRIGQSVKVSPYAYPDLTIAGEITQINPIVDQNGMIKVIALFSNPEHKLAEGMNVKVTIEDKIPNQLVIPKQAMVLRSEKPVVFVLAEGLAKWRYVKTGLENTTSYIILDGLQAGDSIIYEGNLNLAHDARVRVVSSETE